MALTCPSCGYENRDGAAYCGMCKTVFRAKAPTASPRIAAGGPKASPSSPKPGARADSASPGTQLDHAEIARSLADRPDPFLASFGVVLDRSLASVRMLDFFIDETWGPEGEAPDDDTYRPSRGKLELILAFGSYLGEVVRDQVGGCWRDDPAQRDNPTATGLVVGEAKAFPISRAWRRFQNGMSDSLHPFAEYLVRELAPDRLAAGAESYEKHARHFAARSQLPEERIGPVVVEMFRIAMARDPARREELEGEVSALLEGLAARRASEASTHAAPVPPAGIAPAPPELPPPRLVPAPPPQPATTVRPSNDASHWITEGEQALVRQDHAAARAAFQRATDLECASRPGDGHRRLALELLAIGEIDGVLEVLGRWGRSEAPGAGGAEWLTRAERLPANASLETLLLHYAVAAAIAPQNLDAWRELGVGLALWGRNEVALAALDRALRVSPDDSLALTHRGVTLMRMGRVSEALDAWDRAIASDAENAVAWKNRGAALLRLGRPVEEALGAFERSLAIQPNDARVWYSRAECEQKLSRTDAAEVSARRILELPGVPAAVTAGAHSMLATLAALRVIDVRAEQLVLSRRASEHRREGRFAEAIALYDQALALDPTHREIEQARDAARRALRGNR